MKKTDIRFLSSVLVLCSFGISGAVAAPSVKMLGANTARVGNNATVVKPETKGQSASTQRLGTIRSNTVGTATPLINKVSKSTITSNTDTSETARLSLGKYIHSTGTATGTIKPASSAPITASTEFVNLVDRVSNLETSALDSAAVQNQVEGALGDYYTKGEIDTKVAKIVAGDTGDILSGKQDTIDDLETIRSGAAAGATAVQPSALNDYALSANVPSKTSDLTNDSGFLTAHQDISGKQDKIDGDHKLSAEYISGLPTVPTKTSDLENDSGFLTAHQDISGKADKTSVYTKDEVDKKVANIVAGDVSAALDGKQDTIDDLETIRSGAAAGATAVQPSALNDYALSANVPSKTSDLTNDSGFLTAHQDISGKQDKIDGDHKLSAEYISGLPTVPTKTSDLTNDSGFLTAHQDISGKQDKIDGDNKLSAEYISGLPTVPTKTSDLTNDSGFLTAHQDISGKADKAELPTKTSDLTNDSGFLTAHQDISGLISNPTLPEWSGDYLLKVNRSDSGNYTYSWAKASDYSGGGSGSGGSSSGTNDDCDPNWEVCD